MKGLLRREWLLVSLFGLALAHSAQGTDGVLLSWYASPSPGIAGYALYYGETSGNYTARLDVSTNTSLIIPALAPGHTYFFVVTAYDASGIESDPSNEASFIAPATFTVNEGATLTFTNSSALLNLPPGTLACILSNAPAGAFINPTNGVFTWTPNANQVPGTNLIGIVITTNGVLDLGDSETITVIVDAIHNGLSLAPIADRIIHAGMTLTISNSVTGTNIPGLPLSFSLAPGAPSGATIDSVSGLLAWATSDLNANTTNLFTVRVSDAGQPSLNATQSFTVTVVPRPALQSVAVSNRTATLRWMGITGQTYRVQHEDDLKDSNWQDLLPDVTAASASVTWVDPTPSVAQRFYRVLVVP